MIGPRCNFDLLAKVALEENRFDLNGREATEQKSTSFGQRGNLIINKAFDSEEWIIFTMLCAPALYI